MNVLTLEDLLEVSMFRCKICNRRLQSPVLQVGMFGNICGGVCYERSAFTDAIPNVDVETLLTKLQVPCNYKERGCTYDGSYYKTCEHERGCEFRDKTCPLAYVGTCDDLTRNFHNIPAHILSHHRKYVLMGELNSPVEVSNPTESNPDLFYLLSLDNKKFLLRTWIDSNRQCIFYAFYNFESDIDLKSINIYFNVTWENRLFNISEANVTHIQPESALRPMYDIDNAFRISMTALKCINSLESVKFSIYINENPVINSISPVTQAESNDPKNKLIYIKCFHCLNIQTIINFCTYCMARACKNCKSKLPPCYSEHAWTVLNLSEWGFVYDMPCQNEGCTYIITPDEMGRHKNKCLFKKYRCPFYSQTQCGWFDVIKNMAVHIYNTHPTLVNQNNFSVETSKNAYFVRDVCIFKQTFNLSSNGDLSIKTKMLAPTTFDKVCKWEVRMKKEDTPMMMIITDLFNEDGQQKTINVKNYITNRRITLYADIKFVDKR